MHMLSRVQVRRKQVLVFASLPNSVLQNRSIEPHEPQLLCWSNFDLPCNVNTCVSVCADYFSDAFAEMVIANGDENHIEWSDPNAVLLEFVSEALCGDGYVFVFCVCACP